MGGYVYWARGFDHDYMEYPPYRKQKSSASAIITFNINSEQSMDTSGTCPVVFPIIYDVLFVFMQFWPVSKENHLRRHAEDLGRPLVSLFHSCAMPLECLKILNDYYLELRDTAVQIGTRRPKERPL